MESVAAKIHSNYNALNAQHHRDRQELLEHKKKKHGQPNTEKIFMQASLRLQERHEMHLQEVKKKEMETKQHFDAKFEKQRGALTEHHDKRQREMNHVVFEVSCCCTFINRLAFDLSTEGNSLLIELEFSNYHLRSRLNLINSKVSIKNSIINTM